MGVLVLKVGVVEQALLWAKDLPRNPSQTNLTKIFRGHTSCPRLNVWCTAGVYALLLCASACADAYQLGAQDQEKRPAEGEKFRAGQGPELFEVELAWLMLCTGSGGMAEQGCVYPWFV